MSKIEKMVLMCPVTPWLDRLREGNLVWLVKEECYAQIEWAYEPPQPGHIAGRIALSKHASVLLDGSLWVGMTETWFVDNMGCGLDGKQLMLPCENNLPENPELLSEPEIRQMKRTLESLSQRVGYLESIILSPRSGTIVSTPTVLDGLTFMDYPPDETIQMIGSGVDEIYLRSQF